MPKLNLKVTTLRAAVSRDCKGNSQQNCYSEFTSIILSPP